jgi:hypothetical protein
MEASQESSKELIAKSPCWLDSEAVNELIRLVPQPLIRTKRPFRGYTGSVLYDSISSYITAGEYYPVEAAILPDSFWSQCLEFIATSFNYELSALSGVRCQLNCIPLNAKYHPLSIAPHADSMNKNVDVVAVNIPLITPTPFLTAFWNHRVWGSGLYASNLRNENKVEVEGGREPSPFAAEDLISILDDNPGYTTSSKLRLRNWQSRPLVETRLGELCAYNGRIFHSPYLENARIDRESSTISRSTLRISLALFIVFSRGDCNKHPEIINDDRLSARLLRHRVKSSLAEFDSTYSTYRV